MQRLPRRHVRPRRPHGGSGELHRVPGRPVLHRGAAALVYALRAGHIRRQGAHCDVRSLSWWFVRREHGQHGMRALRRRPLRRGPRWASGRRLELQAVREHTHPRCSPTRLAGHLGCPRCNPRVPTLQPYMCPGAPRGRAKRTREAPSASSASRASTTPPPPRRIRWNASRARPAVTPTRRVSSHASRAHSARCSPQRPWRHATCARRASSCRLPSCRARAARRGATLRPPRPPARRARPASSRLGLGLGLGLGLELGLVLGLGLGFGFGLGLGSPQHQPQG